MGNVLESSLFVQKTDKFQELSREIVGFNSSYSGSNIIQDDIFSVLVNCARKNGIALEILRFPTRDDDFCALTCVQKGKIFVYVNSWLPLSNQIFAAAHELYHIWCFIEKKDESVLRKGSFLNAASMDENVKDNEDREANAFAGMLLVPHGALFEQMRIYEISKDRQNLDDIIRLMAISSVPYKAILLRLYEEGYMKADRVQEFFDIKKEVLKRAVSYVADAERWQKRTPEIVQMGSLKQLMEQNQEYEWLAESRTRSDQELYQQILQRYRNERG